MEGAARETQEAGHRAVVAHAPHSAPRPAATRLKRAGELPIPRAGNGSSEEAARAPLLSPEELHMLLGDAHAREAPQMSSPSSAKVCIKCGSDCSGKPRTKDAQGRYTCKACLDAAQHKAAGANAASKPASKPVSKPFGEVPDD